MRGGKRATVVDAKKTRTCVVRLEKVPSSPSPSPPGVRSTRGHSSVNQQQQHSDTKMLRGPLKKRPITEVVTMAATPKAKLKAALQKASEREMLDEMETPPTIAAGRSRRAIKPNPKYTSEDMVTPKLIKNVAVLGSAASERKGDKHRRNSTSSSDDFYNKASSDEEGLGDDMHLDDDIIDDEEMDREYVEEGEDLSEGEQEPVVMPVPKRGRGRPRKDKSAAALQTNSSGRSTIASSSKTTPSQLQMLRKTLETSANRIGMTPISGGKRKYEESVSCDTSVTGKRFKYQTSTPASSRGIGAGTPRPVTKALMGQRSVGTTAHTLNGSKLVSLPSSASGSGSLHENRKLLLERSLAKAANVQQSQKSTMVLKQAGGGSRIVVVGKQSSTSSATPKAKIVIEQQIDSLAGKKEKTREGDTGMHTFTIVNINDIINKKGDALISKAAGNKGSANDSAGVKTQKLPGGEDVKGAATPGAATTDARLNRRKAGHTTILSEKIDPDRLKNPLPRTPFPPKKPAAGQATILNLAMLNNKKAQAVQSGSTMVQQILRRGRNKTEVVEKPAPRILNSMVAKRTQPVKPMIMNMEDSAEESFQLSLDEDEDDLELGDDDDAMDIGDDDDAVDKSGSKVNIISNTPITAATKKPTTTAAKTANTVSSSIAAAAPASATKENSLAATNRLPAKTQSVLPAHKTVTPDKMVVTRQGDRIVKKITCFENWFVLHMRDDRHEEHIRNNLDMPLIQLANAVKSIRLPSESWTIKLMLSTITPMQAKNDELTLFTGDLSEHNIKEADRAKQQPTCVMFRRAVTDPVKIRMPFDRAVIFKNKTFFTNIEGKNVKLEAAPTTISTESEIEILLEIIDSLSLQSPLVQTVMAMH